MQGEEDADHDRSLGLQDHRIAGHEARHAEGGQDHPVRPPVYSVDEDGHTEWQLDLATHYIAKPNLFPCEEQRGWPAAAASLGSLSCQKSVQHQLSSRPPR